MIKNEVLTALGTYGPATIPALSRATGLTERTIRNALIDLTQEGRVRRVRGPGVQEEGRRNAFSLYVVTEHYPAPLRNSEHPPRRAAPHTEPRRPMATPYPRSRVLRLWRRILGAFNRPLSI